MDETRFSLEDFELYRIARAFRIKVYKLIKQLPREERYCLDSQMRRAAISVTNNIAEGHGRWHYQENIRFCLISRGSVEECLDDLNICFDESYGDFNSIAELKRDANLLIQRINGYIVYLKKSQQGCEK